MPSPQHEEIVDEDEEVSEAQAAADAFGLAGPSTIVRRMDNGKTDVLAAPDVLKEVCVLGSGTDDRTLRAQAWRLLLVRQTKSSTSISDMKTCRSLLPDHKTRSILKEIRA